MRYKITIESLLGAATLFNLAIVGWYFFVKPSPPHRPDLSADQEYKVMMEYKDELFLKSIPDENRYAASGGFGADSPRLLLRFSFRHCDVCIKSALTELRDAATEFGHGNIAIAASFLSSRDFEIFEQARLVTEFPCENIPEEHFGLHAERDASLPFFFVLFPDGVVRHVFFHLKEDVGRTRRYLAAIQQRYFRAKSTG